MKKLHLTSPFLLSFQGKSLRYWQITATSKGIQRLKFVEKAEKDSFRPYSFLLEARKQLQDYFSGKLQQFTLPLDWSEATPFYRSVWKELLQIPYGHTSSYLAIARRLGNPRAVRAVGQANRNNPIPIIVPCHRVLASSGDLHGFFYGLELKRTLLSIENPKAFGMQGTLFL